MKPFLRLAFLALLCISFTAFDLRAQSPPDSLGSVVISVTDSSGAVVNTPILLDSGKVTPIQVVDSVKVSEPGGAMSETEETSINWISGLIFFAALIAAYYLGLLKNLTKWQSTLSGIALGALKFITDLGDAGTLWSMTPAQIFQSLTVALFGIIMKNLKDYVSDGLPNGQIQKT